MSAIVAAMVARSRRIGLMRQVSLVVDNATSLWRIQRSADYHEQRLAAAGRAIVAASNAAVRASQVGMVVDDCGCWLVTYGDGSKVHHPWMAQIIDGRPCAWPRPFARGADR